jgi:enoyl-[acyl-carrier protein] reductase I
LDENSIAWKTAERIYEEGGVFVLTNAPASIRMGSIAELAQKTGSTIIPADATSVTDIENLVDQAVAILGGKIDFVLHSIGMSVNVRKGNHYTNQNYDTEKGWNVSAVSFHKVMQVLYKKDAMNEWGVLPYRIWQRSVFFRIIMIWQIIKLT